eukprot:RCo021411
MNQAEGQGIAMVKELPSILRKFALEVRRSKISTESDFNYFATRYFARLAKMHVTGVEDLPDENEVKDVHVYRIVSGQEEVATLPRSTQQGAAAQGMGKELVQGFTRAELMAFSAELLETEHAVIKEIAALRANPALYSQKVLALKHHFAEPLQKMLLPGGVLLSSDEGWAAYDDCVGVLASLSPLPRLNYNPALSLAAREGLLQENESVAPRELCSRFGTFDETTGSAVAQSVCFNQIIPQAIVLQLVVDDDYPTRGNRVNLLSAEFTDIGVCFHGSTCNIILASHYTANEDLPLKLGAPKLPSSFDYSLNLNTHKFQVMAPAAVEEAVASDVLTSLSPDAALNAPMVTAELQSTTMTLSCIQPQDVNFTVEGSNDATVIFGFSSGHVIASLGCADPSVNVVDRGCLLRVKDKLATVQLFFPAPGEYKLQISADVTNAGKYHKVLEYLITVRGCTVTAPVRFPTTFLQSQSCYLITPRQGVLSAKQDFTEFVVEVPQPSSVSGVAVLSGSELLYLERSRKRPTLWCGRVRLEAGSCKLSANIDGSCFEIYTFAVN